MCRCVYVCMYDQGGVYRVAVVILVSRVFGDLINGIMKCVGGDDWKCLINSLLRDVVVNLPCSGQ